MTMQFEDASGSVCNLKWSINISVFLNTTYVRITIIIDIINNISIFTFAKETYSIPERSGRLPSPRLGGFAKEQVCSSTLL